MTISTTDRKAGPFDGNGVTVAFPFTFKVFSTADLYVVSADSVGAETVLVLSSDFTVSLNADQDNNPGGTLTMLTAPATGTTLTITSDIDITQPVELTNMGGFYPTVINTALDRITMILQQLAESVSRSIRFSVSTPSDENSEIPSSGRENMALGFDAAGNLAMLALSTGTTLVDLAASNGASLIGTKRSETGARTMTQAARNQQAVLYVEDFADNTTPGTTDMRSAWNAAITALPARGGKLRSRSGLQHYLSDSVAMKPGVQIELDGADILPAANKDAFVLTAGTFPTGRTIVAGGRIAAAATSTGYGVKVDGNFPFIIVSAMEFRNMARGAYLKDAYSSVVEDVYAVACAIGVEIRNESHASLLRNVEADACTIAGAALNYGGGGTPTHNLTILGGAFQNGPVGLWLENGYEPNIVNPYFEGNTNIDMRFGVADAGVYARAIYNAKVTTPQTSSPCNVGASKTNIVIEHSVGIDIDGAGFYDGNPDYHVSVDAYSDNVNIDYWKKTLASPWNLPTNTDAHRCTISQNGRSLLPYDPAAIDSAASAGHLRWGDLNTGVSSFALRWGDGMYGRPSLIMDAIANGSDLLFRAKAGQGQVRFGDTAGVEYFSVDPLNGRNNFYKPVHVSEAANGKQGVATLVAGAVTVSNTSITADSRIFLTPQSPGGTPGFVRVSARVVGTSFTITSSSGTDTSVIAYEIFEPA